jgi:hypothetical protein
MNTLKRGEVSKRLTLHLGEEKRATECKLAERRKSRNETAGKK